MGVAIPWTSIPVGSSGFTWKTPAGTQPAIGNGYCAFRYTIQGPVITWKIILIGGTTTTWGPNTGVVSNDCWQFILPQLFTATTATGNAALAFTPYAGSVGSWWANRQSWSGQALNAIESWPGAPQSQAGVLTLYIGDPAGSPAESGRLVTGYWPGAWDSASQFLICGTDEAFTN